MRNFVQNVGNKIIDITNKAPENATSVEIENSLEQEKNQEEEKTEE